MALHLHPISDAGPERAPLIAVRSEYLREPYLSDPAFVLAAQVQDLLLWIQQVKEPALGGGHQINLATIEREVFNINCTLIKMRRTPVFPTDMSFRLFKDSQAQGTA